MDCISAQVLKSSFLPSADVHHVVHAGSREYQLAEQLQQFIRDGKSLKVPGTRPYRQAMKLLWEVNK
jgi:hypothetical protein